jgi:hypothetical protein
MLTPYDKFYFALVLGGPISRLALSHRDLRLFETVRHSGPPAQGCCYVPFLRAFEGLGTDAK